MNFKGKKATRDGYGQALTQLGHDHDNVAALDADLAGATKSAMFQKEFPDRFIDCGIAEGNMMDVAAGLSTMGFVPFASTFAMFATGRAYDMIRNSIAYPRLNVKVFASHGGISVGEDGASHQMNEDFALMRAIPNMVVMCPADATEAAAMTKAAYEYKGPVYMRTCRAATPVFHDDDYDFRIGKAEVLHEGTDAAIIATGILVPEALQAAEELEKEGIHVRVLNMGTIKPLDEKAVLDAAKDTSKILTAEEHSVIGGLGEAVAALVSEKCPARVKRLGINDVFGHSGPAMDLLHEYGLDAENIVRLTRELVSQE